MRDLDRVRMPTPRPRKVHALDPRFNAPRCGRPEPEPLFARGPAEVTCAVCRRLSVARVQEVSRG